MIQSARGVVWGVAKARCARFRILRLCHSGILADQLYPRDIPILLSPVNPQEAHIQSECGDPLAEINQVT
jgi:hypothetical protein